MSVDPRDDRPPDHNSINMPFLEDPYFGTPEEASIDLSEATLTCGVVTVAGALREHGMVGFQDPHPILVFRFVLPNGEFHKPIALIVKEDELRDLKTLVSSSVDSSISAARKERKKRGPGKR